MTDKIPFITLFGGEDSTHEHENYWGKVKMFDRLIQEIQS